MSESAPERTGGGGNVFTRKIGPLPMWGWMAVGLLLALGFYLFNKNKQSSQQAASTVNTPGGVDSSLVPQFVNQTYTNVQPPAAPPTVNVTNNVPPDNDNPPVQTGGGTVTSSPSSPLNEILKSGHVINPSPHNAEIGWTIAQKSPNATQLQVVLNGPGVAHNQTRYIPASATNATFKGLQPGHTYVASVTPMDAQGQAVGGPNHVTFVTAKA